MKVLIVDDSSIQRKLMIKILNELGISEDDILQAGDGDVAIETLGKYYKEVGLVLCDWIMPRISGVEFVQAISKIPALSKIPVVIVTVENGDEKIQEAYEKCPDLAGYLTKPYTLEHLKKIVSQNIET